MNMRNSTLFLCPQCRQPLPPRPPCVCGFLLRESKGVINLLTDGELADAAPFLAAYETVRRDEQWGGDDLDLPFHAKRHRDIWAIRRRSFLKFESIAQGITRGVALDVGAGNCWLTRYLDRWNFSAIAVDINASEEDGLQAGQKFIDEGARFLRVRSGMERLPFVSAGITLLVTSASFHYASDFRAALLEFERVLTPGGRVVIMDTPVYENEADGERMIAEREVEFGRKYGIPAPLARRARYLTFKGMESAARSLNLDLRLHRVWPGFRRTSDAVRARLKGRRIAQFPVMVLEKK